MTVSSPLSFPSRVCRVESKGTMCHKREMSSILERAMLSSRVTKESRACVFVGRLDKMNKRGGGAGIDDKRGGRRTTIS